MSQAPAAGPAVPSPAPAGADTVTDPASPGGGTPRIVLDSNVVFDWLVFRQPGVRPLADAITTGDLRWLVTEPMLDELMHVLARGMLARWQPDAEALQAACRRWARVCPAPSPQGVALRLRCRDADDQKFIDLALAERACWLVSRDRAVLGLARRARPLGLAIVTPEAWSASVRDS